MNHREPPQVPQGIRRAGHFLAPLLVAALPGMGPVTAQAGLQLYIVQTGAVLPSGGYLPLHGSPPLRFAAIIIPATPAVTSTPPEAPKTTAGGKTPAGMAPHTSDTSVPPNPPTPPGPSPATSPGTSSPEKPAPLSILPDEMRPQVRPEDFLPFFQIPGSRGNPDVTVAVPIQAQPAQPPPQPSSATYLQTDK
jgi:hypothetical protein